MITRRDNLEQALSEMKQVAEGVKTCSSLLALAERADIYAPIVEAVHAVVEGEMTAADWNKLITFALLIATQRTARV